MDMEVEMRRTVFVNIFRGEKYYVAECSDLSVVTQGKTLDETVENVKEAIALALEDGDAQELGFVEDPVIVITYEVEPVHVT